MAVSVTLLGTQDSAGQVWQAGRCASRAAGPARTAATSAALWHVQ